MRVGGLDHINSGPLERQEQPNEVKEDNGRVFARKVSSLSEQAYRDKISAAIDRITQQGETVAKRADIVEFRKYREMVRELLGETVSNSFEFSKSMRFDSRGRAKTFALIKRVNQTLETMAGDLLKQEADNIELMNSVDDIRGLLVDIFM